MLLAADGVSNADNAERAGVSRPTVISWRARYARCGLVGLSDGPRPGRPRTPKEMGFTHWSSRFAGPPARHHADPADAARLGRAPLPRLRPPGTTMLFVALEIATGRSSPRSHRDDAAAIRSSWPSSSGLRRHTPEPILGGPRHLSGSPVPSSEKSHICARVGIGLVAGLGDWQLRGACRPDVARRPMPSGRIGATLRFMRTPGPAAVAP